LSREHDAMDAVAELLLYAADRRQHLKEVVLPSLEAGLVVITDRFSDSTLAYQGHARGLDIDLLDSLDEAATGGRKPDLTLLLDMDVREGLTRNRDANKVDRLELEDVEFHEAVREGFLRIQRGEPERIKLIDATGTVDEVHARVTEAVKGFLEGPRS
jgi:dTMP kinase